MAITGIERLVYGSANVADAIKFHEDWGLECLTKSDSSALFCLEDGATVDIRPASDPTLPPANIDWLHMNNSTVREVIWSVDNQENLNSIAEELLKDRPATFDEKGTLHSTDDCDNSIGFEVTQRSKVRTNQAEFNTVGNAERIDRPADGAKRQRPKSHRFCHVVYWAPDLGDRQIDFYVDRLGFRLTDRLPDAAFLQSDGCTDHHNLFLQQDGTFKGFQHVSYEVAGFDEMMMLGSFVESQGWTTNVGPLRHNIGSSLSWYIWNPAGGIAEALSDIDVMGSEWQPRQIDPGADGFYGHTWIARPEHRGIKPGQWVEELHSKV